MNYYKRHLGDYAKDTGHLSPLEHGVYTLLLDRYYSTEAPIPELEAFRVARASTAAERKAVCSVLAEFFKLVGGEWHHSYADRVIAAAREKSDKAAESASKRWGKEMRTHSDGNANASQPASDGNASHKPLAISQEKERERAHALPQDWKPPAWIGDRLVMAGRARTWKPEHLAAFVAHYRSQPEPQQLRTDSQWGELFVKWMIRENVPVAPKAGDSGVTCCRCTRKASKSVGGASYCDEHAEEAKRWAA